MPAGPANASCQRRSVTRSISVFVGLRASAMLALRRRDALVMILSSGRVGGSVAQHGAESLENQMKGRHSRLISPDPACIRAAGGHCRGTPIPVSLVIYRTGNFNERAASCRRPQWTPTFCTGQDCRCTRSASCCLGYPVLCLCLGSPTPGHLAGYNPA